MVGKEIQDHKVLGHPAHGIMCLLDEELGLPRWKCVLRTGYECPKFSIQSQESTTSTDASQISFHIY